MKVTTNLIRKNIEQLYTIPIYASYLVFVNFKMLSFPLTVQSRIRQRVVVNDLHNHVHCR